MSLLRTLVALGLLSVICCASFSDGEASGIVKQHAVWLQGGIPWNRPEGETDPHRSYAAARVLYFGPDGKFGVFQGIVIKDRKGLMLSEGDGEAVYGGDWKVVNAELAVNYRLVSWYKMILPAGQKPPEVPGSVQHEVIRLEKSPLRKKSAWSVEFEGKKYEVASGFKTSDLRSHLEIHEQHPFGQ